MFDLIKIWFEHDTFYGYPMVPPWLTNRLSAPPGGERRALAVAGRVRSTAGEAGAAWRGRFHRPISEVSLYAGNGNPMPPCPAQIDSFAGYQRLDIVQSNMFFWWQICHVSIRWKCRQQYLTCRYALVKVYKGWWHWDIGAEKMFFIQDSAGSPRRRRVSRFATWPVSANANAKAFWMWRCADGLNTSLNGSMVRLLRWEFNEG